MLGSRSPPSPARSDYVRDRTTRQHGAGYGPLAHQTVEGQERKRPRPSNTGPLHTVESAGLQHPQDLASARERLQHGRQQVRGGESRSAHRRQALCRSGTNSASAPGATHEFSYRVRADQRCRSMRARCRARAEQGSRRRRRDARSVGRAGAVDLDDMAAESAAPLSARGRAGAVRSQLVLGAS